MEIKVYRVRWTVSERSGDWGTKVFYNLEDAEREASRPLGWYCGTGHVEEQYIVLDDKTHRIVKIYEPGANHYEPVDD